MKRIAYVLPRFPRRSDFPIAAEIRAMRSQGHEVLPIVLDCPVGPCPNSDEDLGPDVIHLDRMATGDAALGFLGLSTQSGQQAVTFINNQRDLARRELLWTGAKIAGLLKRRRCEHVHAPVIGNAASYALVAARLAGASASCIVYSGDLAGDVPDLEAQMEAVDFAVAESPELARVLQLLAPQAHVRGTPFAVGGRCLRPEESMHQDNGRLLYVGALTEGCGIDALLHAMQRLPAPCRPGLDIVGDGPLYRPLEDLSLALGLGGKVRFMGEHPASWVADWAPTYRAFVVPGMSSNGLDADHVDLPIQAAMAMALPVIAVRTASNTEQAELTRIVIPGETGWLIEPGDLPNMARAFCELCSLAMNDRRRMGDAARRRASEEFDLGRQAAAFSALVEAA